MAEHLTTTPSGIEIVFEDGEKDPVTGTGKRRAYFVNGAKLPSVTTVLGILDKPGLRFAAEKLGVAGAIELAKEGKLPQHMPAAMSAMKARGLCHYQVWNDKARRGDLSHEDLVALLAGEEPADIDQVSPEERGFLRGVSAFVADYRPELIDHETMVASVEHGFAGRYDLHCRMAGFPGTVRLDLKTTEDLPRYKDGNVKPPYDEMVLQVAAYELAARESGYGASDLQAVLRVEASGEYNLAASWVDWEPFLAVLEAHRALKAAGAGKPKWRKKVAA